MENTLNCGMHRHSITRNSPHNFLFKTTSPSAGISTGGHIIKNASITGGVNQSALEKEAAYFIRPLSFSRSSTSVPSTFFKAIFKISRSMKVSFASVRGFLSMP